MGSPDSSYTYFPSYFCVLFLPPETCCFVYIHLSRSSWWPCPLLYLPDPPSFIQGFWATGSRFAGTCPAHPRAVSLRVSDFHSQPSSGQCVTSLLATQTEFRTWAMTSIQYSTLFGFSCWASCKYIKSLLSSNPHFTILATRKPKEELLTLSWNQTCNVYGIHLTCKHSNLIKRGNEVSLE